MVFSICLEETNRNKCQLHKIILSPKSCHDFSPSKDQLHQQQIKGKDFLLEYALMLLGVVGAGNGKGRALKPDEEVLMSVKNWTISLWQYPGLDMSPNQVSFTLCCGIFFFFFPPVIKFHIWFLGEDDLYFLATEFAR